MSSSLSIGIIADFNADNLVRLISRHSAFVGATVTSAPFGQVWQTLLGQSVDFWNRSYDLVVVWTLPASVVPRFNGVVEMEPWSPAALDDDVDAFAELVHRVKRRAAAVFVASWVPPLFGGHRPSIEMRPGLGMTTALMRMNVRLAEALGSSPEVVVFNTERWIRAAGPGAYSHKLWYLSKTPFAKAVFEEAAKDLLATFLGVRGRARKVVIVDLDNTLWGDVVGDVGWESIRLGGHDPVGEAYAEFQRELKRLSAAGVLLAIASKNEEGIALEAIQKHPEMVLRLSDFAGWRIDWNDKAANIADLVGELNLGLDAAVFIDDSAHERSRVREALPDVMVPDWPADAMEYAKALRELRCFELPSVTSEDRRRTAMYVSDRDRRALKSQLDSVDEWLDKLEIQIDAERLSSATLERAAQLLNKTNQMNLTTRRLSVRELEAWATNPGHEVWTFRVRDKFGDYGLCGLASVSLEGHRAELVDFVLSCRVMGRRVEEAIMSVLADEVRKRGAAQLCASYAPTKKNAPCLRWFAEQRIFIRETDATFLLDVERDVPMPKHVSVRR